MYVLATLCFQPQKVLGVIAASAGNHALALAYHGRELNIPVTVCMPMNAPIMKVSQCRKYGATVHVIGIDIIEVNFHFNYFPNNNFETLGTQHETL